MKGCLCVMQGNCDGVSCRLQPKVTYRESGLQ